MSKSILKKSLPYLIIGLVGFIIFAGFLIDEKLADALLEINEKLGNKAELVALRLEERLTQVCDRVQLMSLHPLIQEGDAKTIGDLLAEIMSLSSLCETLLVVDYDGSLIAEAPAGWYQHYLAQDMKLELSQGNLIRLEESDGKEQYVFARVAEVQSPSLTEQGRFIVAFANLHHLSESALLGDGYEKISMFTKDNQEIILREPEHKSELLFFPALVNVVNRIYKQKASTYLQGTAFVSRQEWMITISKPFESFLTSNLQANFSGFRFYLVLFFPIFIVLVLMVLVINHSRRYFRELAARDGLTGLFNHRFFQTKLRALVKDKRSCNISLIMIDLDDFKKVNDMYGHQAGDEMLRKVANTLLASIRGTDIAARYGGEEFVLILPGTGLEGALEVAERIRKNVKTQCTITISLGVSSFPKYATTAEELICGADKALYKAKQMSKDRVESVVDLDIN